MHAIPQNSVRCERDKLAPVESPLLAAPTTNPTPAATPILTPEQQQAQATIEANDHKAMLASCLPTLRSELYAAEFMFAEITRSRDVQQRKRKFMKAAGKITGGLPPMTETALRVVANSPKA